MGLGRVSGGWGGFRVVFWRGMFLYVFLIFFICSCICYVFPNCTTFSCLLFVHAFS